MATYTHAPSGTTNLTISAIRAREQDTYFPQNVTDDVLATFDYFPETPAPAPVVTPDPVAEAALAETQRIEVLVSESKSRAQDRLDWFANTRGYDNILSACSYASSTIPSMATEGAYCIVARDTTWVAVFEAEPLIRSGAINSWAEVEARLPVLAWPVA